MNFSLSTNIFNAFYHAILDVVFPNYCLLCQTIVPQQQLTCSSCFTNQARLCSKNIGKQNVFEVFSLFPYEAPFNKIIFEKFGNNPMQLELLGKTLWQTPGLQAKIKISQIERWLIVPVPLHWRRWWWRGFNQAEILSHGLNQQSGLTICHALYRPKNTQPQPSTKSKTEREENLNGAIALNRQRPLIGFTHETLASLVKDAGIIIVDDLLTSGATMLACQQQLKKLNPAKIIGLTACRG